MSEKQQLGLALAALAGGIAWGSLRYRQSDRVGILALLQGLEWFVAYGGAVAVINWLRDTLDETAVIDADDERVTHFRRVVTEQTGTDG